MANSDTDITCTHHRNVNYGAGPSNLNCGQGKQFNHTISGGLYNSQYSAKVQHFHCATVPDPRQIDARLRRAIFLTDPTIDRTRLIQAKGQRVVGTCEWITKDDTYNRWLQDGAQPIFWILGSPGKGKTMLSIFLSQELEAGAMTVYFFCRAGVKYRNTAICVLRGLIWHMLIQSPDTTQCSLAVLEVLQTKHKALDTESPEHMEAALSSRETLWSAFITLLEERRPERVFCVLDGLDECDEHSQNWLVAKLLSLENYNGKKSLKPIVTSRKLPKSRKTKQVINLDLDHNDQVGSDVKTFVRIRSLELVKRIFLESNYQQDTEHSFRRHVEETLLLRSQDTFLWLGFAMAELMKEDTITGVLSAMEHLPHGLHEVYEQLLKLIRPHQREVRLEILGWIVLARRPLSLQELASAVDCQPSHDWLTVEQTISEQIAFCGPLLCITDQKVILVHESAGDYLLLREGDDDGRDQDLRIDLEEMHLRITKRCIHALVRERPLSPYAKEHWRYHARHSGTLVGLFLYYASSLFDTPSGIQDPWRQAPSHQLTSCSDPDESRLDICHDVPSLRLDSCIRVEL
jgi:hypothetical protein